MNLIRKSTVALAALVAAGAIHAQSETVAKPIGSLGVRYVDISLGLEDYRGLSDNAYDASVAVNLPVLSSLDVGFSYGHVWLNSTADLDGDVLAASATYFTKIDTVKPFFSLALGYQWQRASGFGVTVKDDSGLWGAAIGFEVPVQAVTLTPRIAYVDGFDSDVGHEVSYGVEASCWLTAKVAGFVDVSYSDPQGSGGESWNYSLGVRLKF